MSKWILIEVENNDIAEPDVFDTYEEAYNEMEHRFNSLKEEYDDCNIHENYASIQSEFNNFDWRIFEVRM